MNNDLGLVLRALSLLNVAGVRCWVFGGWAEELRGAQARVHKDVDLLYLAEDFSAVEKLFAAHELEEIKAKRSAYKRAFLLDGVMVELFLVREDKQGLFTDCHIKEEERKLFTNFRGGRHDWPSDTLSSASGLPVASAVALASYREQHTLFH